ncbi:MAG: SDR family oxidoreductase [Microbacterium sp.]|nr:SDR family oxidoreductase [Microbacterium sp.]
MAGRMAGTVCLVTGGGQGIGQAIAARLHAEGARVAIADRDLERARDAAAALDGAIAVELDVADLDAHASALDEVERRLGVVGVLVNNAGVGPHSALLDVTPDLWDTVHSVNLRGAFFLLQAVARRMVAHGIAGSIVNVTSVVADRVWMPSTAYAASKRALATVTEYAAAELGPHGIRVNNLCPGPTDTPLSAPRYQDPAFREAMVARLPLGRVGTPGDLAEAALFLASDSSAFTTGSTLYVEGGRRVG